MTTIVHKKKFLILNVVDIVDYECFNLFIVNIIT